MRIHAFKADGRVFGFTASETGENLPSGFGPWTAFKTLTMVRGESLPGVDVDECLDDIEAHGLHVTDAHKRITGQVV